MVTVIGAVIKYLVFCILFPYLLGSRMANKMKDQNANLMHGIFCGYILIWAVIQLISVPMIFWKCSFQQFMWVCCGAFALWMIYNVVRERGALLEGVKISFQPQKNYGLWMCLLFLCMLLQAIYVAISFKSNADDAFYVAVGQASLDTNTLFSINPYTGAAYKSVPSRYVLSPFPIFYAFFSKLVGVKAPVMAHTFLPFILILFVYVVYFMWAKILFKDEKAQTWFMFFVMLILAYSSFSTRARGMMMFPRIWQGKGVLATILLPYILYLGIKIITDDMKRIEWIWLLAVMFASCHVSSMGIMLGAIEIGICGLLAVVRQKRIKPLLYVILCCIPNMIYAAIYVLIR